MKKSLLAAAVATLAASSAFAQSAVTIYGRLNESVERQKFGTADPVWRMQDNGSRLGFKGSEDMGGGLKANFVIEHGFNVDTGSTASSRFWNRESTVGISGGFGAIRLGNMPASEAYFATSDWVDMHNHGTGTSSDALYGGQVVGQLQNAVAYTTPTFGGASVAVQLGLTEGTKPKKPLSSALNYDVGGLHAGIGYEEFNGLKSLGLRAVYELGAFTFGGYYERNSGSNATVLDYKRNNFNLAAMYAMGSSEFHVHVGAAGETGGVANTGAKQFTVAYNYNLSKRTKVYTFFTKVDNQAAASYLTGAPGVDFQSFALGIRHNF